MSIPADSSVASSAPLPVAERGPWGLDPELVFLNHGSFGACPAPVRAAQDEFRRRLERSPVQFMVNELPVLLEETRADLAPFVGADPRDLVFVPNATTAVNSVVRSMELAAGDELIVTDHGYNACNNALAYAAERAGAQVVVARVPFPLRSADEVVDAILACVTPRTRLALLDHVTSPTGLVLPIERLVGELRERGVETLVDGAHAVGMLALDLDALGAGYYTSNAHKWLCAPKGAAFLHVRRDLQPTVRPAVISHGANATLTDRSRFQVEFDWCGTADPTAWLSIKAARAFMEALDPGGIAAVRARNRALVLAARDTLCAALGIDRPAPDDMIGSLASVPLPDGAPIADGERPAFDADPLQRTLFERYRVEVPVHAWPAPPKRLLRVSAQVYNRTAEYEHLASALRELAGSSA